MTRSPDSDGRAARVSEEHWRAMSVAELCDTLRGNTQHSPHYEPILRELARRASAPAAALVRAAEAVVAAEREPRRWVMPLPMLRPLDALREALAAAQADPPPSEAAGAGAVEALPVWSSGAWWCKIGPAAVTQLPKGADWPMRKAVQRAFRELTGRDADYVFSGWGAALTEGEHAVAYPQQKEAGDA